jgi:hypothetical protein
MLGARKDVHLAAPAYFLETNCPENPGPLCRQQSSSYSAGPEVDIVFRVLGDQLMNDDVAHL